MTSGRLLGTRDRTHRLARNLSAPTLEDKYPTGWNVDDGAGDQDLHPIENPGIRQLGPAGRAIYLADTILALRPTRIEIATLIPVGCVPIAEAVSRNAAITAIV